ncbi:response regulator [Candidatus Venteria ishoeyi]|uniref:Sensory/regulatory protein RpfC n=1 Tax=Candidatus Venteria ishoeyi TaxID=1899563 RepID=A0A1H6FFW8_9GAMM|nr:response regulator [Candidatus Venteria ishoeyi]MDM8545073.1 response regulator [Candidatus Venteria ishoeyi]SEH07904.1 Signal transduction histidine-protein kinase BarA [Candidatus Venteria ishoeyi]
MNSIRAKLLFYYIPLVGLSVLVLLIVLETRFYLQQYANLQDELKNTADVQQHTLLDGLWEYDMELVRKLTLEAGKLPYIHAIQVFDDTGILVAQAGNTDSPPEDKQLSTIRSIIYKNEQTEEYIGKLVLSVHNRLVVAKLMEHIKINVLIMLVLLSALVLVTWFVAYRVILEPLERLHNSMQSMKENNPWQPVTWSGNDEISDVITDYNELNEKQLLNEKKLIDQAYLLDLIFKHSLDSMVLLDKQCNYIRVSESYAKACHQNVVDLLGRKHFDIFPTSLKEEIEEAKKNKIFQRKSAQQYHFFTHPGSDAGYWDIALVPILDKNNEIKLFLLTLMEVSERKQAEQALQEAKNMAEEASEVKSRFLANMSHEIRTPLNAVTGMAYLLKQTQLSERQAGYINSMHNSMTHVIRLIDDLLDFSKLEANKLALKLVFFDLDQVLDNVTELLLQEAERKKLELLFSIPLEVPRALVGDPTRLGQVLINLAGNAIKFSEQGEVLISIAVKWQSEDEACLCFTIKDRGIGMNETQQSHLFEAFQQGDNSITRRFGGSGLGLVISRYLVEAMGGNIEVKSLPGKGSTFRFSAYFGLQAEEKHKPLTVPTDLRKLRFLVVDDNDTSRQVMATILDSLGFDFTLLKSGAETVAILEQTHNNPDEQDYNVILLDWMMPEMNGCDTARHINHNPALPTPPLILMVSAYEKAKVMAQASRDGIVGYLHKPVSASQLFDTLMSLFGKNLPKAHRRAFVTISHKNLHIDGGGRHILIAEDHPTNRIIAEEILQQNGFKVTLVENGQQAVECIEANPSTYAAVLMDLQMPVMDGYEAVRHIRRQIDASELPIIAMTAHTLEEEQEKCRQVGMNAHVAKPVDVDKLLIELSKQLGITTKKMVPASVQVTEDKYLPQQVPGINLADGLVRLRGNQILYHRLLRDFPVQSKTFMHRIHKDIAANTLQSAANIAHALAGSAGNLSMMPLYKAAKTLQQILEAGKPNTAALQQLQQCQYEVVDAIASLDLVPPQNPETIKQESSEDISQYFHKLTSLLVDNDMAASEVYDKIMAAVTNTTLVKELEAVGDSINKLNYPKALQLLKSLNINKTEKI